MAGKMLRGRGCTNVRRRDIFSAFPVPFSTRRGWCKIVFKRYFGYFRKYTKQNGFIGYNICKILLKTSFGRKLYNNIPYVSDWYLFICQVFKRKRFFRFLIFANISIWNRCIFEKNFDSRVSFPSSNIFTVKEENLLIQSIKLNWHREKKNRIFQIRQRNRRNKQTSKPLSKS